ncbi:MAG TPA: alanine racemase [Kofleriaceae bacterium]|nr:alanine racemase [Kofleriaceae bacterium]
MSLPGHLVAAAASGGAIRPTAVEIDLDAVVDNARAIARLAGTALYAVVKADAYGHGAPMIVHALEQAGACAGFAVSLVEEGTALRDAGVRAPILVMGPSQRGGHDEMIARGLTPVVSDASELELLAAAARGQTIAAHLKVDTGMSRLGVPVATAVEVATRARALGIDVVGLMTHLADADVDDPADASCPTWRQLGRFDEVVAAVRAAGVPVVRHAANSSGAMLFPSARLDLVRVGLALYGNGRWAPDDGLATPRRQVMRFVTRVAQLRRVEAGARVGYGGLWTASRPTTVAVLPVGYADGLPRRVTGHAEVLVAGRRCPLVGAVSMDIAIADVTDLPDVAIGDEVVLLGHARGRFGEGTIRAAELATWAGVTEYEVTCGVSKRVPRVAR